MEISPPNAVASVRRRSFSLICRGAVRSFVVVSVIMALEEKKPLVDPVCSDVAALAVVGADVREASVTGLE